MKKLLAFLLALCLVFTLCTLTACHKDEPDPDETEGEGTNKEPLPIEQPDPDSVFETREIEGCDLSWSISRAGVLTIFGTGEMTEFDHVRDLRDTDQPWAEYVAEGLSDRDMPTGIYIRSVVVEAGVTSVSEYAFKNCAFLTSVTFAESVTAIPYCCFDNCPNLSSVSALGVTTVAENAFAGCRKLASLSVSTPLATVEYGAFYGAAVNGLSLKFTGTEAEWETTRAALSVAENNAPFSSATVTCYPK